MKYTFLHIKYSIKIRLLVAFIAVICSVALPQLLHAIGKASGLGPAVGAAFLPMHIPVFAAGFFAGSVVGILTGIISPSVSFLLSGMPDASILPFMTIELAVYGLVSGLLSEFNIPVFLKVYIVQLTGRIVNAGAVFIAVFVFDFQSVTIDSIWNALIIGLPGILLQWAIIPLIIYRIKYLMKYL